MMKQADSRWLELNKKRITELEKQGLATKAGIVKVKERHSMQEQPQGRGFVLLIKR